MCGLESFCLGMMRKRDNLRRGRGTKTGSKISGRARFELFVIQSWERGKGI